MKYLHALLSDGRSIHINKVDKSLHETYICAECGGELIAKKGKINAHHFAHKYEGNCSRESYLHKISKIRFFEAYTQALNEGTPFHIEYLEKEICNTCRNFEPYKGTCEFPSNTKKFDLTKRFDLITVEKKYGGFVADVLLESSTRNDVMFIEFAVTHSCEQSKINSGIRIVEYQLREEKDLDALTNSNCISRNHDVTFYNFTTKSTHKEFYKNYDCRMVFDVFYVSNEGKAISTMLRMSEIYYMNQDKEYRYFEILNKGMSSSDPADYAFIEKVFSVSKLGINVRNCFACRFSTKNNRKDKEYDLFCKRHKAEIEHSNTAASCKQFWRVEHV